MKRFLIISAMILASAISWGQSLGQTTITSYDISAGGGDTLIKVPYDFEFTNYAWRIDVVWDSVVSTADGILSMKSTGLPGYPADSSWVAYPNMSDVNVNSGQGECSFQDDGFLPRRIGVFFDMNTITDGRLYIYLTLKPR
jgi:hypothetical protein